MQKRNINNMNWGKWIIVSFVLFTAFIATLVVVCVRQDVSLVAKDYYKDELAFQRHIEQQKNAASLATKPQIRVIDHAYLQIFFPQFREVESGKLQLFRPSRDDRDQLFEFKASDDSVQRFEIMLPDPGMYRAKLSWTMNGKEFYVEEVIYI